MGGKHLKRIRAEKAKIKLKKKTLTKAQNVTDTSFKVKHITLMQQLRKVDEDEAVSSKNVPLKDLLSQLHHYNANSRLKGLTGLSELLKANPEVLKGPSIRPIITNLLEIFIDLDSQVRKQTIGLLEDTMSKLPSDQLTPFYDNLNLNLGCAMTHINIQIQRDSLLLLDLILKYTPDVIKINCKIIIRNYARLLGNYRYGSQLELLLAKGSVRDLRLTRIEILNKLYEIFVIIFTSNDNSENEEALVVHYTRVKGFPLRTLVQTYKDIPTLASIVKKPAAFSSNSLGDEAADMRTFINVLMPLLLDTWAEFSPATEKKFDYDTAISEGSAKVLEVILKIIYLLYEETCKFNEETPESKQKEWFVMTYSKPFNTRFMTNFPYVPNGSFGKSQSFGRAIVTEMITPNSFSALNVMLCYFYYSFKYKNNDDPIEDHKIQKYVTDSLVKRPNSSHMLANVATLILSLPKLTEKDTNEVLSSTVKAYMTTSNTELRQKLFKVVTNIALDDRFAEFHTTKLFLDWTKTLPLKLLKPKVSVEVISNISNLRRFEPLIQAVEKYAKRILEELPRVIVEGADGIEGQKLIANILYWCSEEVLTDILRSGLLSRQDYPPELQSYLIHIFSSRFKA